MMERITGVSLSLDKLPMMQVRLSARLRVLELSSFKDYCTLLSMSTPAGLSERQAFVDAITTHKTDFFREPEHFVYLVEKVLPQLKKTYEFSEVQPLLLWSAASSSGEEAYTMAMALADGADYNIANSFHILATDVAVDCVNIGVRAVYKELDISPVPLPLRQKYLLKSKDPRRSAIRIAPELRARVEFKRLNLMSQSYDVPMQHVIFLRNVLIYFERDVQAAVVTKLAQRLLPGGYLFLSHTENVQGLDIPLDVIAPSILRRSSGS